MAAARHFNKPGTLTPDQLAADIEADIRSARSAQQTLQDAGQRAAAERMRQETDTYLDEYSAARNGTWRPDHAR
jgi:hypothetical protein